MGETADAGARKLGPRDFASVAGFCLFLGGGLSLLLWHIHAWFNDYLTTGLAIFLDGAAVLFVVAATSGPWGARRQFSHFGTGGLLALLLLWGGPAYLYITGPDLEGLVRQSQAARDYRSDPSCNGNLLRELAKQRSMFEQGGSSDSKDYPHSICKVGWTKVQEKSPFHSCLVLHGNVVYGNYCGYFRFGPGAYFDWGSIRVGDSMVAQTAYGRPAAYFFESKELTDRIVNPRGVVFLTSSNPDQEFRQHLSQSILPVGLYLTLGAALLVRLIG